MALASTTGSCKYVRKGISSFNAMVFTRSSEEPSRPTGGSYDFPIPDERNQDGSLIWSSSIPEGEDILWSSTRVFSSNSEPPQEPEWSIPRQMTDTADFDVEFSSKDDPKEPSGHPNIWTDDWSNFADVSTKWMATSLKKNGNWEPWTTSKIKGEKGDAGTSFTGIDEYYQWHNNGNTAPSGIWKPNEIPPKPEDTTYRFLWNYEVVKKSDGTEEPTEKHVISSDGRGIKSLEESYVITDTEEKPDPKWADWKPTMQIPTDDKPFLWNREYVNYTDDTFDVKIHLIAKRGDKGDIGPDGLTFIISNSTFAWRSSKVADGTVGIRIMEGSKEVPYGTGGEDGFILSDLNVGDSMVWSFLPTIEGYTYGYYIAKKAGSNINTTIKYTITYKSIVYQREIHISCVNDGERGKRGQIPYPAGEYIAGEDVEYECTEEVTPFVLFQPDKKRPGVRYIMNKVGTWNSLDKSKTPQTDYAANGAKATWIPFQKYKFLETEIALVELGLIGKSVFWDNYAFSQDGKDANGKPSSNYQLFDPTNFGSTGSPFTPNFLIDWVKGILMANNASVSGTITSTSGKIGQFTIDEYGLRNTEQDKMARILYSCENGERQLLISGFNLQQQDVPNPLCYININNGTGISIDATKGGQAISALGKSELKTTQTDQEIKIEGASFRFRHCTGQIYAYDDFVELVGDGPFILPTGTVTDGKRIFVKNMNGHSVKIVGEIMSPRGLSINKEISIGNESMMFIKDPLQWVAFYCG